MIYLRLMARGFWIVLLTAMNVIQVTGGHYVGAFWIALLISMTWWTNAYTVSLQQVPPRVGAMCYGLGVACGTVTGMALLRWWYA